GEPRLRREQQHEGERHERVERGLAALERGWKRRCLDPVWHTLKVCPAGSRLPPGAGGSAGLWIEKAGRTSPAYSDGVHCCPAVGRAGVGTRAGIHET